MGHPLSKLNDIPERSTALEHLLISHFASLISVSMTSRSAFIVSTCSQSCFSSATTGDPWRAAVGEPAGNAFSISLYKTRHRHLITNAELTRTFIHTNDKLVLTPGMQWHLIFNIIPDVHYKSLDTDVFCMKEPYVWNVLFEETCSICTEQVINNPLWITTFVLIQFKF